jgi:DNA/RNA endonuclease YhcR with UshA esterase domain
MSIFRCAFLIGLALTIHQRTMFARATEPVYVSATVISEMATVIEVREVAKTEVLGGLHLTVKTDSGTLDVHLGPRDYVAQFEFSVAKGDRVKIAGSKVRFRGTDVVLAREVRSQQSTLYLRDAKGVPFWNH